MSTVAIPAEMVVVLRSLINDLQSVTYDTPTLSQLLSVAGRFVTQEMDFSNKYFFDVVALTVTPDPTDTAGFTRDDSLINLTCLKAACMIDRGETKVSAGQAVDISDAGSRISVGGIAQARLALLKIGYCTVYNDAKNQYLAGQAGVAAAAVMTPFRVFAGDNANLGYYPYEGRSGYNPFP